MSQIDQYFGFYQIRGREIDASIGGKPIMQHVEEEDYQRMPGLYRLWDIQFVFNREDDYQIPEKPEIIATYNTEQKTRMRKFTLSQLCKKGSELLKRT